jgi:hypothetical protein
MSWLVEPIATIRYGRDQAGTFALLVARLGELGIPVEKRGLTGGKIVARCLTLCLNWIFWRCWSDHLEFVLKADDNGSTTVEIGALPNLLRTGLRRGENACDVNELLVRLRTG